MILKKKLGGFIKLESNWTALVVFIVLTLFFFHHILTNLDYEADYDWKQVQFYHESARKSIVEYGQLPLWNPYECGGNVLLANPQQRVLSPMFIFTILFGTIIGLKIEVVLHLILGCLGMFVLAKHFKLKGVFAYIPPIVFMFSALFIRNLQAGSYDILPMAYMPFVIYYFLRGLEQSKYIFISCIFLVFTWFEGGIYVFIGLIIFLAIYTLFIYIEKKDPRCFLAYVKLMVVTFIFGAIKFIPNLFLFFHTKRVFQLKTGIGILDLLQTMIFPTVSHLDMNQTEYVLYVGIIITLLFLLGAVLCWKKNKTLILTTGVMTLIIMGFESSIPIWPLMKFLPIFNSLWYPMRFRILLLLAIAILSAAGLEKIISIFERKVRYKKKIKKYAILIIVLGIILFNVCLYKSELNYSWSHIFFIVPKNLEKQEQFNLYQPSNQEMKVDVFVTSHNWDYVRQNKGSTHCYEAAPIPNAKREGTFYYWVGYAMGKGYSGYIGTSYLFKQETVQEVISWSPNRVKIKVRTGEEDTLILNQNHYSGWHADILYKDGTTKRFRTAETEHVVSIPVDSTVDIVEFYYLPTRIISSFVLSILGIVIVIYFGFIKKPRKIKKNKKK